MTARAQWFRVEVACDGYAALMESDVPDGEDVESYIAGARSAAEAIRGVLGPDPASGPTGGLRAAVDALIAKYERLAMIDSARYRRAEDVVADLRALITEDPTAAAERARVDAALREAFSGDEYEENAAAAAGEAEWSWFKWLATNAVEDPS